MKHEPVINTQEIFGAIYTSLTDLFVSASAVIILIIVLLSGKSDLTRYWDTDFYVRCNKNSSDGIQLYNTKHKLLETIASPKELIKNLPTSQLSLDLIVETTTDNLSCFIQIQSIVIEYNHALGQRNSAIGPIITTEWLPLLE